MKNLGVIIIIIAAIILIVCGVTGELINENAVTFGCVGLIVVGLIVHIIVNKKYIG